ncbi:MAG: hypothetical protein EOO33_06200 [Comamonadaceae bacterium]|nr:MAG: hypothetical protein EOO33_06200 [Comamonadaceae bacterium]
MGLILLEALLALVVLVAIVWWTMFSGRKRGELPQPEQADDTQAPAPAPVPEPRTPTAPAVPVPPPRD